MTKRKTRNSLVATAVLAIVITSAGCQAASDLFNPDTYNFQNSEPWERNKNKKGAKPKTLKDQM